MHASSNDSDSIHAQAMAALALAHTHAQASSELSPTAMLSHQQRHHQTWRNSSVPIDFSASDDDSSSAGTFSPDRDSKVGTNGKEKGKAADGDGTACAPFFWSRVLACGK